MKGIVTLTPRSVLIGTALHSLVCHAETDPIKSPVMGMVQRTTAATADSLLGLPLHRTPVWVGEVTSVLENEIGLGASFTVDELVSGGDTHYVLITSGSLKGYQFTVAGNSVSSLTLDPKAAADVAAQGLAIGDTLKLIPYWTLGTVFPGGSGIAGSSSASDPETTVKVYNHSRSGINPAPEKTYFFYTGGAAAQGWYDNDALAAGLQDDVVLLPDSFIVVRNVTSLPEELVLLGTAPDSEAGTPIGRLAGATEQDNLTVNPYPQSLTLGTCGLIASGAVEVTLDARDPVDTVKLYTESLPVYNRAPDKSYFYYAGSLAPQGWYDNDALGDGLQDSVVIPAGAPIVIRKGVGAEGTVMWIPPLPY